MPVEPSITPDRLIIITNNFTEDEYNLLRSFSLGKRQRAGGYD